MRLIACLFGCHKDWERVSGTCVHLLLFSFAPLQRTGPHTSLPQLRMSSVVSLVLVLAVFYLCHCTLDVARVRRKSLQQPPFSWPPDPY